MRRLFIFLVLLVIIATLLDSSFARKGRKRNHRRKSNPSSTEASTTSSQSPEDKTSDVSDAHAKEGLRKHRGSRRKEERRERRKKLPVLKTSIRAKKVTERKYLKSDWCKSQPVRQHIQTTSNCHGVVINQFCYGQCNSFYIPKDIVIDPDQEIESGYFKSCSFCKPKTLEWISVRLRCKNVENTKMPHFITKQIKRVKGCTCVAVPDLEKPAQSEESNPSRDDETGTLVLATIDPNR